MKDRFAESLMKNSKGLKVATDFEYRLYIGVSNDDTSISFEMSNSTRFIIEHFDYDGKYNLKFFREALRLLVDTYNDTFKGEEIFEIRFFSEYKNKKNCTYNIFNDEPLKLLSTATKKRIVQEFGFARNPTCRYACYELTTTKRETN